MNPKSAPKKGPAQLLSPRERYAARVSAVAVETVRRPLRAAPQLEASAPAPRVEPAPAPPREPPSPLLELVNADPLVVAATDRVSETRRARNAAKRAARKAQRALNQALDTPGLDARDAAELAWTAEIRHAAEASRAWHLARADRFELLVATRRRVRAQLSGAAVANEVVS